MMLPKLGTIIALLVILLTENCSCAFSPSSRRLGRLLQPCISNDEHFCLSAKVKTDEDREGSLAAATKALGKVPYGETSRKYRRTVFNHDDWVSHR